MTFHLPVACLKCCGVAVYSKLTLALLACSSYLALGGYGMSTAHASQVISRTMICFLPHTRAGKQDHFETVFESSSSVAVTACVYDPTRGEMQPEGLLEGVADPAPGAAALLTLAPR